MELASGSLDTEAAMGEQRNRQMKALRFVNRFLDQMRVVVERPEANAQALKTALASVDPATAAQGASRGEDMGERGPPSPETKKIIREWFASQIDRLSLSKGA